ncbi:phage head closure protein [Clostridium tyrobutyricum]|uniref:Phage head-tail adaptor, putative n=1 Tax=Clostridium tyrobutyricum DIVETGP TaxID=1408889 RepID=W6NKU3_CLOTY|nr:phage head closure protein [Clostridium tyrobutyricum]AND85565.1 putative phage head-tail adaptor [Clostridium tyrobutyricum]ANP70095.1 head-tail adaptor protein [Clostridium tyrobutyricum]MBV4434441.1 phage head closure protein [Clostridium tyrobutyricum]QNB65544.1 phage head closure protein [Clostridium tyrobutyricum]CDL92467.1 phage head-tail adaptor, putative [Clostridium tyrobutyricum DIVETGP]
MRTEELKHKIIFQKLTATTNENGFEVEVWEDYSTVWAEVSNLMGREYFAAAAGQAEKTVKFTIRYLQGITDDMRILFEDKQYNITFIDNIKYRNKYIEIKALEVENSG